MSEVIQNKIEKLTTKIQALSSDKEKLTHTLESVSLDLELAKANLETLTKKVADSKETSVSDYSPQFN